MPLLQTGRPSTPAIDLPPLFSDPPLPRASTAAALQGHRDRNGDAKSASGSGQARSMAPRVAELGQKLTGDAMQTKAVCSELAFLASRSMSACTTVADGRLESKLSRVLSQTSDPHLQCDVVGILSNCATASRASCARQAASIATLSALVASANPEVQHAAALHLATLSHSDQLSAAIGKSRTAIKTLRELERQASETLASPGHASLRQQAAQYARWALRTPRGFHLKPAFKPKPLHVQEHDSSVQLQARVRSSFVANQYRNEMKARRAAAAVVQASYRGHHGRTAVAQQILAEGAAAALLQALIRGRQHRKDSSSGGGGERVVAPLAGACGDGTTESSTTDAPLAAHDGESAELLLLPVPLYCADGDTALDLSIITAAAETHAPPALLQFGLPIACLDGGAVVDLSLAVEP